MAKNFSSEGDLVTTQPNSVHHACVFSLSTGNMGKGSEAVGSEVNGNYKMGEATSEDNIYKLRANSLKTGSRVSFADMDGDGNLIKMCSESELDSDADLLVHNFGRSLSYSTIERTKNPDLVLNTYMKSQAYDTHSLTSVDRLSTSPIQEEVPEMCEMRVNSKECDTNNSEITGDTGVDEPSEHSHDSTPSSSPVGTMPMGKPPLPNGKLKQRPGTGKQSSWLLRLFESRMFDMSIAISYLFNSKEPGVQTYLGNVFIYYNYIESNLC